MTYQLAPPPTGSRPWTEPGNRGQDASRAVLAHLSAPNEQPEGRLLRGPGRQAKLGAANRTRYRCRFPQRLRLWKDRTKGGVRGATSFGDTGTWLEIAFLTLLLRPLGLGRPENRYPTPRTGSRFLGLGPGQARGRGDPPLRGRSGALCSLPR